MSHQCVLLKMFVETWKWWRSNGKNSAYGFGKLYK